MRSIQFAKENKVNCLIKLKNLLQENKEILELSDIIRNLEEDIDAIKKERTRIVLLGTFGAGKTTLLKSLLSIEFLPIKSGENSSTVVFFYPADDNNKNGSSIIKINIDGLREITLNSEQTKNHLRLFLEKQAGFSADDAIESNYNFRTLQNYLENNELNFIKNKGWNPARDVNSVSVYLDNDLLKKGAVLVDTPGIGSITEKHEEITISEIKRCSAFIYLFDSNQFGTKSDFDFLRMIWDYRDKSIFVFNKADILMTDKANHKDVDEIINEFINKIPNDFNKENLPKLIPLSTILKFGNDLEVSRIMSDLNDNYRKKDKKPEELSNWDEFLKALEDVINKLKDDERLNTFQKIDFDNYKERVVTRIEDSIKELNKSSTNNLDNKINSKIEKINHFKKQIKNIQFPEENTKKRIKNLEYEIKDLVTKNFEEINNIFENEIETLTVENIFEQEKHKEPLSKIKTKIDRLKNSIDIKIKENLFEYINDVVKLNEDENFLINLKKSMIKEINFNFSIDTKQFYQKIQDYDREIKKLENEKENLEKRIFELERKNKLNEVEKLSFEEKLNKIQRDINDFIKRRDSLGKRPEVKIIFEEQTYVKETRMFTGNPKTYDKLTIQRIDDSDQRYYDRELEKVNDEINKLKSKESELLEAKRNIHKEIILINNDFEIIQKKMDEIKSNINRTIKEKDLLENKLKVEEHRNYLNKIWNYIHKQRESFEDLYENSDSSESKINLFYWNSLDEAIKKAELEIIKYLEIELLELKKLEEYKKLNEIEKVNKINSLNELKEKVANLSNLCLNNG